MDNKTREFIDNLGSSDDKIRLNALQTILKLTEDKVEWINDVWNLLVAKLDDENSYQRSIGIMVLCNLAKSDTENRVASILDRILAHTRDEKFITSRQCIQNVWKLALTGSQTKEIVLKHLEKRFKECTEENHYNLIRQDIVQSMRMVYDTEKDDGILARAKEIVKDEAEEKYRKKYESFLKVN